MNIINDDFTPVCTTAAAISTVASHAVEHPPKTPPNHWQADLNRVIAHDHQMFRDEMITKKRQLQVAYLNTFGQTLLLSLSHVATIPTLLVKLNTLEAYLEELKGRYRSDLASITKERKEVTNSGADAATNAERMVMSEENSKALEERYNK